MGTSAGGIGTDANCDLVAETLHAVNPVTRVRCISDSGTIYPSMTTPSMAHRDDGTIYFFDSQQRAAPSPPPTTTPSSPSIIQSNVGTIYSIDDPHHHLLRFATGTVYLGNVSLPSYF